MATISKLSKGARFLNYTLLTLFIVSFRSCKEPPSNQTEDASQMDVFIASLTPKGRDLIITNGDTLNNFQRFADNSYQDSKKGTIAIFMKGFTSMIGGIVGGRVNNMVFHGHVMFDHSRFGFPRQEFCDFTNVQFDSSVHIESNYYDTSVLFSQCKFKQGLEIVEQFEYGKVPEFWNCDFNGAVVFSRFPRPTSNLRTTFKSDLLMFGCNFNGKLDLSYATFHDSSTLVLLRSSLPDTLDLTGASLSGPIDLTVAYPNPRGKCYLNLLDVDVKKLKLQYNFFRLYFPDSVLQLPTLRDKISSTYESLLANFKSNAYNDSYETLDIEYNLWKSKTNVFLRLEYYWWMFQYEKWRILVWTIAFFLSFSIWNGLFYKELQRVYHVPALEWSTIQPGRNYLSTFVKKVFAVFLYTGFIFFRLGIDLSKLKFSSVTFIAMIIGQYVIGLICTGFLINWILG